jgi:hypothetical protein
MYGTADDALLSSARAGTIGPITIVGTLTDSGNPSAYFGLVSHGTMGTVTVGGSPLTLPWLLGNIRVKAFWG